MTWFWIILGIVVGVPLGVAVTFFLIRRAFEYAVGRGLNL